MSRLRFAATLLTLFFAVLVGCSSGAAQPESSASGSPEGPMLRGPAQAAPEARNPGPISERSIEIVQKSRGVFVYSYAETLDEIQPYEDYKTKREITSDGVIRDLRALLAANAEYQPQFTARCLPVWEYGVEFRESPEERRMFLFSFRCNVLVQYEERSYRDFSPQATDIYALLEYEVNERSSRIFPNR